MPLHAARGAEVPVDVWGWTGPAHDQGDAAAAWLSAYVGQPVRLVRYPTGADDPHRVVEREWTRDQVHETAFADGCGCRVRGHC